MQIVPTAAPNTNNISAPTPAPVPITPVEPTCVSRHNGFKFRISDKKCERPILRKRHLSHKTGKGKGSAKSSTGAPCCEPCKDHNISCPLSSTPIINIYSCSDRKTVLYRRPQPYGRTFNFVMGENMPDCLVVEIGMVDDFELRVIQTVSFHTDCSNDLQIGTSIGGLEIVGFI